MAAVDPFGRAYDQRRRVDRTGLPDPRRSRTYASHRGLHRDKPISYGPHSRNDTLGNDGDSDSDIQVEDNYPEAFVRNQSQLNRCFKQWNVSFEDPENFCATLVPLLVTFQTLLNLDGQERANAYNETTNCITLHDFLIQIKNHPDHSRRHDARSILDEIDNRIKGYQWRRLTPTPAVPPQYIVPGTERQFRSDPSPAEIENLWSSGAVFQAIPFTAGGSGQIASSIEGLRCPPPALKPRHFIPDAPFIPPGNEIWTANLESRVDNMFITAEAGLNTLMSFGELSEVLGRPNPEMYLYDSPLHDTYLPMPEGCRFLTGPEIDETNPELQNMDIWPDLEIIDERVAPDNDPLSRVGRYHYLYILFSRVRELVTQPRVARRFAIVFRAPPDRYGPYSNEELVNELPPTNDEIELVIFWFSSLFPPVHITRDLPPNVYGSQPRGRGLEHININAKLIDAIEIHRQDMEVGHLLLLTFQTLVHELAHWLYAKMWYRPEPPGPEVVARSLRNVRQRNITIRYGRAEIWPGSVYLTPRKMRFFIHPHQEFYDHPDYRWRQFPRYRGEMGTMIEWMVFGYELDLPPPLGTMEGPERYLSVLFYGSSPGQNVENQVQFTAYGAGRLLQAQSHTWTHRNPAEVLELATFLRREAALQTAPPEDGQLQIAPRLELEDCLSTRDHIDKYDADELHIAGNIGENGTYRRAIQYICKERRETEHKRRGQPNEYGCIAPSERIPPPPPPSIANGYPTLANRYLSLSNITFFILACSSYFYNYKFGIVSISTNVPSYIPNITVQELSSVTVAISVYLCFLLERRFLKLAVPTIISLNVRLFNILRPVPVIPGAPPPGAPAAAG
ncbi:uncharacterized protein LAJ45_10068 [Morchella importuna]|uniref:uncharacterized protein n=1 Tax=Morchella importuna TaxID=1174673 RepID=UPI001E8CD870|nr:uncharacterized protein LAJ45_10068 [Morchella importuna]KAH8145926.1 hypothetical protein LAJ45_10068 [Morchella importuna]